MFDEFLRARAERDGTPFRPFDVGSRLRRRTSTASRGWTAPTAFLRVARHRAARGRARTTRPDAETCTGWPPARTTLVQEKIATVGVEVYPGSVRYLHAVKDAGLATAVVSSSANAEQVLDVAGLSDLIDHRVDGVTAKERGLPGKPAPDTFLAAAADLGVDKDAGRGVRGRARRAWPPGRRAGSASSSGSTGSGRPTRCARTAPTSSSPTSPTCWRSGSMSPDPGRAVHRRAVGGARAAARPGPRSARSSRCSRCPTGTSGCAATSTRGSRTRCRAPT